MHPVRSVWIELAPHRRRHVLVLHGVLKVVLRARVARHGSTLLRGIVQAHVEQIRAEEILAHLLGASLGALSPDGTFGQLSNFSAASGGQPSPGGTQL
jgi:hypothetical protein